jgi:hypothetical protein
VLHVLLTSFKSNTHQGIDALEEVLKAGVFYHECVLVNLRILSPTMTDAANAQVGESVCFVADDVDDDD